MSSEFGRASTLVVAGNRQADLNVSTLTLIVNPYKIALVTQVITITITITRCRSFYRSRSQGSLAKQRLASRARALELVLLLPEHQLEQCRPLSSVVFSRRGIQFRLVHISYFTCSFFSYLYIIYFTLILTSYTFVPLAAPAESRESLFSGLAPSQFLHL